MVTFHGTDHSQTHGHDRISRRSCRTRESSRFQGPLSGRACSRELPHPSLERRSRSSSPGEYAPPSRICRRRGRGWCQHSLRPFPLTLSGREHAETDERTEHGLTGKEDGAQDQKENDDLHGRILSVVAYSGESSPRARRSASDSPVSAASPRISSIGVSVADGEALIARPPSALLRNPIRVTTYSLLRCSPRLRPQCRQCSAQPHVAWLSGRADAPCPRPPHDALLERWG